MRTSRWIKGWMVAGCVFGMVGCESINSSLNTSWNWGASRAQQERRAAELAALEKQQQERWIAAAERKAAAERQAAQNSERPGPSQLATPESPTVTFTGGQTTAARVEPAAATNTPAEWDVVEPVSPPSRPVGVFGEVAGMNPERMSAYQASENLVQITFTNEGSDFDPDIDRTGQWVAFASTRHRKNADIYIQKIGGTSVRQLTQSTGNDVMPCFSPDGRTVAFSSDRGGSWDLWLTTLDGGHARQLTNGPSQDIHPSFSPDGRRIVYSSWGARSGQWELWVVDVENPANKQHIGYGLFPKWSPTDNRILFQKPRQRGQRWFSVWMIELEDGEARRPTELVASSNAAAITPTWSPDGRHVVFTTVSNPDNHQGAPNHADIWLMDVDGKRRVNLTQNRYANLQPIWSVDGTIYFVSNRGAGGVETIWALRPRDAMHLVEARWSNPDQQTASVPGSDED